MHEHALLPSSSLSSIHVRDCLLPGSLDSTRHRLAEELGHGQAGEGHQQGRGRCCPVMLLLRTPNAPGTLNIQRPES